MCPDVRRFFGNFGHPDDIPLALEAVERRRTGMEIETVLNYLANSINLDGVRAEEIKKSLAADITEKIMHAQQLG